jgi:diaminopimelate decarboxylase
LVYALKIGFPVDRVLFSANNMTDGEMHYATERGVMLNVGELSRLEAFGQAYPGSDVCVRLNGQVGAGHHEHVITAGDKSKFGIPVEQVGDVHAIARKYDLTIVGLHQHIGSGIMDTKTLWQAISVILDASSSFENLRFINVGGGLGIAYRPDEQDLDMSSFDRLIVEPLKAFIDGHPSEGLAIWFEPGRFFTAQCGVLLAHVNTVKEGTTRTFAGTDSGMNHLVRPAMYGAYHHVLNLSNPEGPLNTYDVVGNICESSDFFAKDREVAQLREGDIIGVLDAGAYGMSMTTTYNMRSKPAEVWIDLAGEQRLVRPRRTVEEMVAQEMRQA